MRPRNTIEFEKKAIKEFNVKKIMTITMFAMILKCSLPTARRRLKEWKVYTSYNKNGKYYTLQTIPEFNKKGIWKYEGVYFSKHGNLKNTIIQFINKSSKGLTNNEIEKIIGVNPNSFLPQYKDSFKKEKLKKEIVYFSKDEDIYHSQKQRRFTVKTTIQKLAPDAINVCILVEIINNPEISVNKLITNLNKKDIKVDKNMIENLFEHYNINKKKLMGMSW
jgi:hypothetical protein